jgi:hypothetical protein
LSHQGVTTTESDDHEIRARALGNLDDRLHGIPNLEVDGPCDVTIESTSLLRSNGANEIGYRASVALLAAIRAAPARHVRLRYARCEYGQDIDLRRC